MKKIFQRISERLYLWELRGSVEYWEKEVLKAEDRLDFARWARSHYREELRKHDQAQTR
jgi:hypothetical protein